jgi:rare lipoprotein A
MRKMCVTALLGMALWSTPSLAIQSNQPSTVIASYYDYGSRTASGERFRPDGLTAAHRTMKFGTMLKVTNQTNGRSVVVRINDRGPFVKSHAIDLSRGAARSIGMLQAGVARVTLELV